MNEWADDIQDWEYPDPDEYDDEAVDTVVCPECGTDVYEEAVSCPSCGYFLTQVDRSGRGASRSRLRTSAKWLVLILIALALGGVLTYIL